MCTVKPSEFVRLPAKKLEGVGCSEYPIIHIPTLAQIYN